MIAVVCAACQGSASQPPSNRVAEPAQATTGSGGVVEPPPPDAGPPLAREIAPTPLRPASHGRAIISVAISDDGGAALTLDSGDSVRLWPALDGTREPVAVPLVAPTEMVLARSGDEFHIAALDTAGGLVLLRVDANGLLVGKTAMPFDQPYERVVATGDGYLAIRADQTIERLDAKGAQLGTLAPERGQRVASLVARRGRVMAFMSSAEGVVGRWLDPANGLAWGAATPLLAIDPATAVLSPDHTRLAALQNKTRRAVLVDLATGVTTPVRGQRTDLVPLNWTAHDRVAFAHDEFELSRVEWFDAAGKRVSSIGDDFELEFVSVLQMEAADQRVVSFLGHQLVLVEPRKLRYLGYQAHAASRLRATPAGIVASMGGSSEILDDSLQIERPAPTKHARELIAIDETFALAILGTRTKPGVFDDTFVVPPTKPSRVEVVLFEGQERRQVLKMKLGELRLRYEPTTRLLATTSDTAITFARFDPATQRFDEPIALAVKSKVRDLVLLDPAAANGAIALLVHGSKGELVVRAIHEDELTGEPARAAITLPGELEAIDRAGHVYVRHDADTVAIHDGSNELGRLTGLQNMTVRPAPDGKRLALFGRGRVILADLDGSQRWSIGFPGIKDVQWTDDELVALANGIAKLDPDTGATVTARCGWKFGLRSTASFINFAGSTLCDR